MCRHFVWKLTFPLWLFFDFIKNRWQLLKSHFHLKNCTFQQSFNFCFLRLMKYFSSFGGDVSHVVRYEHVAISITFYCIINHYFKQTDIENGTFFHCLKQFAAPFTMTTKRLQHLGKYSLIICVHSFLFGRCALPLDIILSSIIELKLEKSSLVDAFCFH